MQGLVKSFPLLHAEDSRPHCSHLLLCSKLLSYTGDSLLLRETQTTSIYLPNHKEKQQLHLADKYRIQSLAFSSIHDSMEVLFLRIIFICIKNNMPTTVVPSANPKANKVAANATNPRGRLEEGLSRLHSCQSCVPPRGPVIKLCVHGHNKSESSMDTTQWCNRRSCEGSMVLVTTTMMIHLPYTSVALPAVMGTWCFVSLADLTILEINGILRIFQFPPQRDKAQTNKHGIEVIIKNHDSPIDQHDKIHTSSRGM